jgi:hypothetical protein
VACLHRPRASPWQTIYTSAHHKPPPIICRSPLPNSMLKHTISRCLLDSRRSGIWTPAPFASRPVVGRATRGPGSTHAVLRLGLGHPRPHDGSTGDSRPRPRTGQTVHDSRPARRRRRRLPVPTPPLRYSPRSRRRIRPSFVCLGRRQARSGETGDQLPFHRPTRAWVGRRPVIGDRLRTRLAGHRGAVPIALAVPGGECATGQTPPSRPHEPRD